MTDFVLKRDRTHPHDPDSFRIETTLPDGYVLTAGHIGRQTGTSMKAFWTWNCIKVQDPSVAGGHGQADTREEALLRFKEAWAVLATPEAIAWTRGQAEWTDEKYTIFDTIGGSAFHDRRGRCVCGAEFDPHDDVARKLHVPHLKKALADR